MTAAPEGGPPEKPKKPPKIVVTLKMSEAGKTACQWAATDQGYEHYTNWMRDVLEAEVNNPKHKPTPKK